MEFLETVVLRDSDVTFLGEREDAAFCPFLCCLLLKEIGQSINKENYFEKSKKVFIRFFSINVNFALFGVSL